MADQGNRKRTTFDTEVELDDSESIPTSKSWNRLYLFVLSELAILILIFYAFSRFYQ